MGFKKEVSLCLTNINRPFSKTKVVMLQVSTLISQKREFSKPNMAQISTLLTTRWDTRMTIPWSLFITFLTRSRALFLTSSRLSPWGIWAKCGLSCPLRRPVRGTSPSLTQWFRLWRMAGLISCGGQRKIQGTLRTCRISKIAVISWLLHLLAPIITNLSREWSNRPSILKGKYLFLILALHASRI